MTPKCLSGMYMHPQGMAWHGRHNCEWMGEAWRGYSHGYMRNGQKNTMHRTILPPLSPSNLPTIWPNASPFSKYSPSTERPKGLLSKETSTEERTKKREEGPLDIHPPSHHSAFCIHSPGWSCYWTKKVREEKGRPTNGPLCPTPSDFDHYRHLAQKEGSERE